jgi:hypothetical protein
MQNDSEKLKNFTTETCFLSNVIRTLSEKKNAVHIPEYVAGLSFGSAHRSTKQKVMCCTMTIVFMTLMKLVCLETTQQHYVYCSLLGYDTIQSLAGVMFLTSIYSHSRSYISAVFADHRRGP